MYGCSIKPETYIHSVHKQSINVSISALLNAALEDWNTDSFSLRYQFAQQSFYRAIILCLNSVHYVVHSIQTFESAKSEAILVIDIYSKLRP
jgi:hypothetical protein